MEAKLNKEGNEARRDDEKVVGWMNCSFYCSKKCVEVLEESAS